MSRVQHRYKVRRGDSLETSVSRALKEFEKRHPACKILSYEVQYVISGGREREIERDTLFSVVEISGGGMIAEKIVVIGQSPSAWKRFWSSIFGD